VKIKCLEVMARGDYVIKLSRTVSMIVHKNKSMFPLSKLVQVINLAQVVSLDSHH